MYPRKIVTEKILDILIKEYEINFSVKQAAAKADLGINRARAELKKAGKLKSISELASMRIGAKNPFYGKSHTNENKRKHSAYMRTRVGKLNPNYRHGNNERRRRDFLETEFKALRNLVYKRDNHTCQLTQKRGGDLHAHHLIPYWICKEAYLDIDNIITVSKEAHLEICHLKDWARFNVDIISDSLLNKYKLNRERLNELASMHNTRCDSPTSSHI